MKKIVTLFLLGIFVVTSHAFCEDISPSQLQKAIEEYDVATVKKAISNKVDLNKPLPSGALPIHMAVELGSADLVKTLIAGGAKANRADEKGMTAFDGAIVSGHFHLLPAIFDTGEKFDLEAPRGKLTPLTSAARAGNASAIEFLLSKGAKVDAKSDEFRTPLSYAIESKSLPAVKALLKGKARLNVQDKGGKTPLHEAIIGGQSDIISTLLDGGARQDTRDIEGITPLGLAIKIGDKNIIAILQQKHKGVS